MRVRPPGKVAPGKPAPALFGAVQEQDQVASGGAPGVSRASIVFRHENVPDLGEPILELDCRPD